MPRKKVTGTCRICGVEGNLSFEHVPPRQAFNNKPVLMAKFEDVLEKGTKPVTEGRLQQKGVGGHTLCERCNNNTGSWYGTSFVDWTYQALLLQQRSGGNSSFLHPYHIFPLRVIKQVITMFFSVNSHELSKRHPDLVQFILDKERRYINPSIKFYAYLMEGTAIRMVGLSVKSHFNNYGKRDLVHLSEIAYPPCGYVMTIDSPKPDIRLFEISHFAHYKYNEWINDWFRLPVLPVHMSIIPGDYRTEGQIEEDYLRNVTEEEKPNI